MLTEIKASAIVEFSAYTSWGALEREASPVTSSWRSVGRYLRSEVV